MEKKLIKLYKDMSELTAPECANTCRVPHSCCDSMYCDMAEDWIREHGWVHPTTDHPTLKFMSPLGCVLPPHFRPICTLHTCAVNSVGGKVGDPAWTAKYFQIRQEIEELEWHSAGFRNNMLQSSLKP